MVTPMQARQRLQPGFCPAQFPDVVETSLSLDSMGPRENARREIMAHPS